MHPRNRYQHPHDFTSLASTIPDLSNHFITTPDGRTSLDFTDPEAVRLLNKALLLRDYGLKFWDIPKGSLCPGVPGRLDYIHAVGELLGDEPRATSAKSSRPGGSRTGLDIGTGASLIYPILGVHEYGWAFVGTDLDDRSLKVAGAIAKFNPGLTKYVELRKQHTATAIFHGIIRPNDLFDFTLCNPPFFADAAGAKHAAEQKWAKLGQTSTAGLNFGGRPNELWTPAANPPSSVG